MREHGSIIIALRPQKPEGSLGRTAQDGHLNSHPAPELWRPGYVYGLWDKYSDKVQQALILVAHLHASFTDSQCQRLEKQMEKKECV